MKEKKNINQLTSQLLQQGYKLIPNQRRHFVNKDGVVVSIVTGVIKQIVLVSNNIKNPSRGYYFFRIYKGKPIYVHKLVYELFVGPIPKGYDVHHISGNTSQNNVQNLQLLTKAAHMSLTHKNIKHSKDKSHTKVSND